MLISEISAENREAIVAKYLRGVSLERLQKEYGCTRYIIRRIVTMAGHEIRGRGRPKDRTKVQPVLTRKLAILADQIGEPVNDDVLKTIVLYALKHNDGRTFRKIDRRYDYNGTLSAFRRDHLEASYYVMGRLWRYVYRAVMKSKIQHSDYGVAAEDARLCMKVLDEADREKIRAWVAEHGEYVHLPNEDGVHRVVSDCAKTIHAIVNSKLRFIYQYDPCYEKEDMVSYLMVIAYRVAVKYDWEVNEEGSFDYLKCLNYTKRSLWNAAQLLIKENTGEDYRRLEKVDTDERVYQVTTVSMDTPMDDEWLAIESKLGEDPDTTVEVSSLISSITDKRLHDFLKLENEDVPEFTEFVLKETGKDENDLYVSDYSRWRTLAQRFAGLMTKDDRGPIKRAVLSDLGMLDLAKARRRSV